MKKYIIIILLFTIALTLLGGKFIYKSNFKQIKNGNNTIIYNKNIKKSSLKKFLKEYPLITDKFYLNNEFSKDKIKDNYITIILLKNDYSEFNLGDPIIKKYKKCIEKKFNISIDTNLIGLSKTSKKNTISLYLPGLNTFLLIYDSKNILSYIISEYSHYLIEKNIKKNKDLYKKYLYNLYLLNDSEFKLTYKDKAYLDIFALFDEAVTNFYYHCLFNEHYYNTIDNKTYKILKNKLELLFSNTFYINFIGNDNLYNELYFLGVKYKKYVHLFLFVSYYIYENYGYDGLMKFIKNMYNLKFSTIDEFFEITFNKNLKLFLIEMDKFMKKLGKNPF